MEGTSSEHKDIDGKPDLTVKTDADLPIIRSGSTPKSLKSKKSRSVHSASGSSRSISGVTGGSKKKRDDIERKLEMLNKQIADVREKRKEVKPSDDMRVYGPKRDYSKVQKKMFSHPKLDYVYGEIMHSPYLTPPTQSYPQSTYSMPHQLKELKRAGVSFAELPDDLKPYDHEDMKRQFIKEVCNYNPKFNIPKAAKKDGNGGGSVSSKNNLRGSSSKSCKSRFGSMPEMIVGRDKIDAVPAGPDGAPSNALVEGQPLRKRQFNAVAARRNPSAMSLDATLGTMSGEDVGSALLCFQQQIANEQPGTPVEQPEAAAATTTTTTTTTVAEGGGGDAVGVQPAGTAAGATNATADSSVSSTTTPSTVTASAAPPAPAAVAAAPTAATEAKVQQQDADAMYAAIAAHHDRKSKGEVFGSANKIKTLPTLGLKYPEASKQQEDQQKQQEKEPTNKAVPVVVAAPVEGGDGGGGGGEGDAYQEDFEQDDVAPTALTAATAAEAIPPPEHQASNNNNNKENSGSDDDARNKNVQQQQQQREGEGSAAQPSCEAAAGGGDGVNEGRGGRDVEEEYGDDADFHDDADGGGDKVKDIEVPVSEAKNDKKTGDDSGDGDYLDDFEHHHDEAPTGPSTAGTNTGNTSSNTAGDGNGSNENKAASGSASSGGGSSTKEYYRKLAEQEKEAQATAVVPELEENIDEIDYNVDDVNGALQQGEPAAGTTQTNNYVNSPSKNTSTTTAADAEEEVEEEIGEEII